MRRVVRLSRRTPRDRSSAASVRTTDGSEVSSVAAAAVRLPFSTIRTNVAIAESLSMRASITPFCGVVQCPATHLFHSLGMRICRPDLGQGGAMRLAALIGGLLLAASSVAATADVITDWDEKAV